MKNEKRFVHLIDKYALGLLPVAVHGRLDLEELRDEFGEMVCTPPRTWLAQQPPIPASSSRGPCRAHAPSTLFGSRTGAIASRGATARAGSAPGSGGRAPVRARASVLLGPPRYFSVTHKLGSGVCFGFGPGLRWVGVALALAAAGR